MSTVLRLVNTHLVNIWPFSKQSTVYLVRVNLPRVPFYSPTPVGCMDHNSSTVSPFWEIWRSVHWKYSRRSWKPRKLADIICERPPIWKLACFSSFVQPLIPINIITIAMQCIDRRVISGDPAIGLVTSNYCPALIDLLNTVIIAPHSFSQLSLWFRIFHSWECVASIPRLDTCALLQLETNHPLCAGHFAIFSI